MSLPWRAHLLCIFEHAIGLAHSRCIAEVQVQLSAPAARVSPLSRPHLLGVNDDIDTFRGSDQTNCQFTPQTSPEVLAA